MYSTGAGARMIEKIIRKGKHKPIDSAEKN